MKERPILFSAPMVRALLAGTKTQTRRVAKLDYDGDQDDDGWPMVCARESGCLVRAVCPYGVPGDRLWVREAFKFARHSCADDGSDESEHECGEFCEQTLVYYSATPREGMRAVPDRARMRYFAESTPLPEWYTKGWKPSIHMPRWASRITLEVTGVRVERVQSISEADAKAEGVTPFPNDPEGDCWTDGKHTTAFQYLWGQINGFDSWAANPWVWAVEFRRLP